VLRGLPSELELGFCFKSDCTNEIILLKIKFKHYMKEKYSNNLYINIILELKKSIRKGIYIVSLEIDMYEG
jgi:hypothetical protein